ncbi:hypothetical protein [Propionicimonas sp.]|uniref:hypothetical protein n=1 Tax=Propionicimonas sp. TaxID=1955623 RepID=UPI0039E38A97
MSADVGRRSHHDPGRFWRLALAVCAALALAAAALGTMGALRGPTLAGATVAVERTVSSAGTQLTLRSRQPIDEVSAGQVSVTPASAVTVASRDNTVTVRFATTLAYATGYTVRVTGVRSPYTGRTADWRYSFTTPAADVYSLLAHRGAGDQPDDEIVTEAAGARRTVLTAAGIDEYTVTPTHVVAISHPDDQTSRLVVTDRDSGAPVADVRAPEVPALALLQMSSDGTRFGYTATGTDAATGAQDDNTLYIQDATQLEQAPTAITNAGQALAVQDWRFVPGVSAVVVLALDGQAYLIYLDSDTRPVPLGSLAQLVGFTPGNPSLVAEAGGKPVLLDLTAGSTTPIQRAADTEDSFTGRTSLIGPDDYVAQNDKVVTSGGSSRVVSRLIRVTGGHRTILTSFPPAKGQVIDSGISPNGQFAWATVLSPDAPADELTSGASSHAITTIVDATTGRLVGTVPGSTPVWAVR